MVAAARLVPAVLHTVSWPTRMNAYASFSTEKQDNIDEKNADMLKKAYFRCKLIRLA